MRAKATYSVKRWDETTVEQMSPERKITHASVEYGFEGDLQGIGSVNYVMFYTHVDPADQHRATATYVSLIHFKGTVSGRQGSFAMTDVGTFESGAARSSLSIIQGSGAGDLERIRGTAAYHADSKGFVFDLDYDL